MAVVASFGLTHRWLAAMETIAGDIRRGLPWVVLPLLLASGFRLFVEPIYCGNLYFFWLLLLPFYFVAQRLILNQSTPLRIRLSLLTNFVAINVGYLMIGIALRSSAKPGWRADGLMFGLDQLIFHGDPQRFLTWLQTPWLSSVTILCYIGAFSGFLFYLFLCEAFTLSPATGHLQLGLMRLYGFGFSGYLLLPAAGPAFHHPNLLPSVSHSILSAKLNPWVLGNCSGVDVCPSLHAAICAFTLIWIWRHHQKLFPFVLLPGLGLLLGTVYFKYHYFLDLPAGLLLGTAAALSIPHDLPAALHPPSSRSG